MRSLCLLLLFFGIVSRIDAQSIPSKKEIVAYYPDWQVYDRNKLASPDHLNFKKIETIVYAFFVPDNNGYLKTKDAYITELILKGKRNWQVEGEALYYYNTSLVDLAHAKNTSVMISIGGWTGSEHFSAIAADSIKRSVFTNECVRLVNEYGVDGIDIDWEFPGRTSAKDSINFTTLLVDIRRVLDEREATFMKREKRPLLLSIAISSSDQHMKYIQWDKAIPHLDFINVMTYDYSGSWVKTNAHKSPLYRGEEGGESIANTVKILREKYNVPDKLLNIGSSFTGNAMDCYSGEHHLGDIHKGEYENNVFATSKGQPTYYQIKDQLHLFEVKWDSISKVNYFEGKEGDMFLTCETERSLVEKARFIQDQNLRGLVIWDITGDILETNTNSGIVKETPLLSTAYQILKK